MKQIFNMLGKYRNIEYFEIYNECCILSRK